MKRPSNAEIRAELERVIRSQRFARKPRLAPLLSYLVEKTVDGQKADLKERTIAIDLFDKGADYEGGDLDAIVRSNMHKLRQELLAYFEDEGRRDPVVIQLKKGRYENCLTFSSREGTPIAGDEVQILATEPETRTRNVLTLVADCERFNNVQDLEQHLREVSGDPTLRIRQIHFGSQFYELDSSLSGAQRLMEAQAEGILSSTLGYEVGSVAPAEQVYDVLRAEQHPALENCYSAVIDISSCSKDRLSVFIECDIPEATLKRLAESQNLQLFIAVSEDAKTWLSTHRPPIWVEPQQLNRELFYPLHPNILNWKPTTDARFLRFRIYTLHLYGRDRFPTALFVDNVRIPNSTNEPAEVVFRKEVLTLESTGSTPIPTSFSNLTGPKHWRP